MARRDTGLAPRLATVDRLFVAAGDVHMLRILYPLDEEA